METNRGPRKQRLDARRSRRALLQAAGELLQSGQAFSLSEVAQRAGVSTATAYRHFHSAESVADVYVAGFLDDLEARAMDVQEIPPPAEDLLLRCSIWVQAVLDWGHPLTRLRSPQGFLKRYLAGDDDMGRAAEFIAPTLGRLLVDRPSLGPDLIYLLSVWNALSDPREILDQHEALGWTPSAIAQRLCETLLSISGTSVATWPP